MIGKVIAGIITITLITFLILLITFYFLQENIKVEVNRINYQTVEIVATQGYFSSQLYEELRDQVNKYGDYFIQLKLERVVKDGVYDVFYHSEEILNQPLQIGDRITVFLEDGNDTIFARLLTTAMGSGINSGINQQIKSLKTGIIAKNAKDMVKGYDVMADIYQYSQQEDVAMLVITKMNGDGKYYGYGSHPDVDVTNPFYGDSDDERGNTGINYIFDNGNFNREINYYSNGEIRLITYIQQ